MCRMIRETRMENKNTYIYKKYIKIIRAHTRIHQNTKNNK